MREYLKNDLKRIILLIIIVMTSTVLFIIPFSYFGEIIDLITKGQITMNQIVVKGLIMFAIAFLTYIMYSLSDYVVFYGNTKYIYVFQDRIIRKILKQTPRYFDIMSIGEVMGRLTGDIYEYMTSVFSWLLFCGLNGFIGLIFITIYISLKNDLVLAFLVNIPHIIVTIIILTQRNKFEALNKQLSEINDEISESTLESIQGVRIVRSYNLFPIIKEKFDNRVDRYAYKNSKYMRYHNIRVSLNTLSVAISYFFLLFYGFYLYSQDIVTLGSLIGTSLIMIDISSSYYYISEFLIGITVANVGFKRVNSVIDAPNIVDESKKELKCEFKESIEFRDFNFSYDENKVLENISFKLNKGCTLGIVGKTASGKTTLVKQLLRLYDNQKGILIDGIDILDYDVLSVRKLIGYCPQQYYIFSETIKENILFNRNLEDSLDFSLQFSDLKKDILTFTDGVNTKVGENGISLSGGQKQRLSIARAVISDPEILILDDSLSALDSNTQNNIIENIQKYRKGKTNIIVSHRISTVVNADIIIVLNDGRIENIGNHEQLLEKSKWYNELYSYQQERVIENEK